MFRWKASSNGTGKRPMSLPSQCGRERRRVSFGLLDCPVGRGPRSSEKSALWTSRMVAFRTSFAPGTYICIGCAGQRCNNPRIVDSLAPQFDAKIDGTVHEATESTDQPLTCASDSRSSGFFLASAPLHRVRRLLGKVRRLSHKALAQRTRRTIRSPRSEELGARS